MTDRPGRDPARRTPRRHRARRHARATADLDGRDRRAAAGCRHPPSCATATRSLTVDGRDSVLVAWPFRRSPPARRATSRCACARRGRRRTAWSEPLASRRDSSPTANGSPSRSDSPTRSARRSPFRVRTTFTLDAPVRRAALFWTALGVAEPEVNGAPVSDDVLSPGWTSYRDRLVHETVDVTAPRARRARTCIGATVAGAWYTEKYGFFTFADRVYGDQPSFLAQLRLEFEDGTVETIATGDGWRADGDGPVVASGIYAGEHQDLRLAPTQAGRRPAYDDARWAPVRVGAAARRLRERAGARRRASRRPCAGIDDTPGRRGARRRPPAGLILDFGQNLVGRLRLRVGGPAGTAHHGAARRGARRGRTRRCARCATRHPRRLRPRRRRRRDARVAGSRSTASGTREIDGWPGEFDPAAVEAVVLHTDMTRTGWFDVIRRAARPPARERRLGHARQLPVDPDRLPSARRAPRLDRRHPGVRPTASFLYDCDGFLTSWLRDLALEQARNDGNVPLVVPAALPGFGGPAADAAWGDAATVVPMGAA